MTAFHAWIAFFFVWGLLLVANSARVRCSLQGHRRGPLFVEASEIGYLCERCGAVARFRVHDATAPRLTQYVIDGGPSSTVHAVPFSTHVERTLTAIEQAEINRIEARDRLRRACRGGGR